MPKERKWKKKKKNEELNEDEKRKIQRTCKLIGVGEDELFDIVTSKRRAKTRDLPERYFCPVEDCTRRKDSPFNLIRHIFRCHELGDGIDDDDDVTNIARWCSACKFICHVDVYLTEHYHITPCPFPHCRKQWRKCQSSSACKHDNNNNLVEYSKRAYDTGVVMVTQLYCNMPEDLSKIVLEYM